MVRATPEGLGPGPLDDPPSPGSLPADEGAVQAERELARFAGFRKMVKVHRYLMALAIVHQLDAPIG